MTSDTESHSLQVYLPESSVPMRLIVRLALLSVIAVVNFTEGFVSVGPYVQMMEGLDVIEVLKGAVKMIFFPDMFLALLVLEVPMISSQCLSPVLTSFLSFARLTSHGLDNCTVVLTF